MALRKPACSRVCEPDAEHTCRSVHHHIDAARACVWVWSNRACVMNDVVHV
jgi:hypothetical protein